MNFISQLFPIYTIIFPTTYTDKFTILQFCLFAEFTVLLFLFDISVRNMNEFKLINQQL